MLFPNGNTHSSCPLGCQVDIPFQSCHTIGQTVRERRIAQRLTQRELSELAGVGVRLVSELERGKSTLRTDAVNRVLAVFGLMLGAVEAPRTPVSLGDNTR